MCLNTANGDIHMTIWQAILQGAVQGLTEFLPISSSGHLSLAQHFLGLGGEKGILLFSVMLHLGTLAAVFVAFFSTIKELFFEVFRTIRDIFCGKFSYKNANETRKMLIFIILALIPLLAFFPFKDFFAGLSEDNDIIVEGVGFLYSAALLFIADIRTKKVKTPVKMNTLRSLGVGVMQGIAVIPGISRSGSTICSGLIMGISREYMVKFSFILSIPVILAANVTEIGGAISEGATVGWLPIIIGMVTSAIVGWLAIKMLSWMIKNDKLYIFGVYLVFIGVFTIVSGVLGL